VTGDDGPDLLAFQRCGDDPPLVYPGQGDGTFAGPVVLDAPSNAFDLAVVDVESDGIPDVVAIDCEPSPRVLVHRAVGAGTEEPWLSLRFSTDDPLGNGFELQVADINGDGYQDFTATFDDGSGERLVILMSHPGSAPLVRPSAAAVTPARLDDRCAPRRARTARWPRTASPCSGWARPR